MKTIIAGPRNILVYHEVAKAIESVCKEHALTITEVVSGGASGVDQLGELWAERHGIPVKKFEAQWMNFNVPNLKIVTRSDGSKYNLLAGFNRNQEMADYADVLIAVKRYKCETNGTNDMIKRAVASNLDVFVFRVHPALGYHTDLSES